MARGLILYFDIDTGYYPGLHHGLAYLMGSVNAEPSNDVEFIHIFKEEHLEVSKQRVENNHWDFVGVSFTTNQRKFLWQFLKTTDVSKQMFIAGGVHPTLDKQNTFKQFPQLDAICVGEGEAPLLDFCQRINSNEDVRATGSFIWKKVDAVGKATFQVNPVARLRHIDDLADPDYTVFDYKRIISDSGDVFAMMLGRGCPYQCTYCASAVLSKEYPNPEDWVRFPSIPRSIRIIKDNLKLYPNTRSIIFADDTFTVRKEWVHEFCKAYKEEIGLPFECNARVETVSDQVCEDLKSAGCRSMDFGVESGNEWLRNNIVNRKHKNKKIIEAFQTVERHGIRGFSYNIVGMPFETPAMMKATYELNKNELKAAKYGRAFYYYPYPGTGMHELSLKYNLLRDGIDQLTGYLEAPTVLENHATHKEIRKYFKKINLLFAVRLACDRLNIPFAMSELIVSITQVFWRPLAEIAEPDRSNKFMMGVNRRLKLMMKRLSVPGHGIYGTHQKQSIKSSSDLPLEPKPEEPKAAPSRSTATP